MYCGAHVSYFPQGVGKQMSLTGSVARIVELRETGWYTKRGGPVTHNGISLCFWQIMWIGDRQVGERGKTSEQGPTEMETIKNHCQTLDSAIDSSLCSESLLRQVRFPFSPGWFEPSFVMATDDAWNMSILAVSVETDESELVPSLFSLTGSVLPWFS